MKFGTIPLADAKGAILAHSLKIDGKRLKKGRVLSAADVEALRAAAHATVMAARLEPGDFGENDAAAAVAAAAAGGNVTLGTAATGRCNLYAEEKGLLVIDCERVDAFNSIDEAVTLSTLPPYQMVEPGQLVATAKIITFGVSGEVIDAMRDAAGSDDVVLRVAPFQAIKAGLLQTVLPGAKEGLIDKTVEVTRRRLAALGSSLTEQAVCRHDEAETATALKRLADAGCDVILVLGSSAIVDRRDVVPAAVERAGGAIDHFGMPVDPGNLMLLASLGRARVLGLPGSARSPRLHGFDWVLRRFAAGLPVNREDVVGMGVGGLLKEMPGRPLPRAKAAPAAPAATSTDMPKRIAALVLAAGQSRRMGAINKLLAEIDGVPMVRRTAEAVLASDASPVVAVTGHEEERVRAALHSLPVTFAHNSEYTGGLSTSLRAGLAVLPDDIEGLLVCLGDMPRIGPAQIGKLIAAYEPAAGREICVPVHRGKRGNPVLWGRRFFAEMDGLAGDVGARHLIGEHDDVVAEVEMDDDAVLTDVDTPAALAKLSTRRAEG